MIIGLANRFLTWQIEHPSMKPHASELLGQEHDSPKALMGSPFLEFVAHFLSVLTGTKRNTAVPFLGSDSYKRLPTLLDERTLILGTKHFACFAKQLCQVFAGAERRHQRRGVGVGVGGGVRPTKEDAPVG